LRAEPDVVDVHVGRRVRHMRILQDQTQEQLGEKIGVSYQQIQKYETGANRISASRLYWIAVQFGVAPGWFFEGLERASP
jgi:transcriptional regulator with XRE-family HTH domain